MSSRLDISGGLKGFLKMINGPACEEEEELDDEAIEGSDVGADVEQEERSHHGRNETNWSQILGLTSNARAGCTSATSPGRCSSPRALRAENEKAPGSYPGALLMIVPEHLMATPAPRKRRSADPQTERTVKTSLILGAELHTKLAAAAAIAGVDRNALAVGILSEALRGIVVVDRRKGTDRFKGMDRRTEGLGVIPDGEDEAA